MGSRFRGRDATLSFPRKRESMDPRFRGGDV
jgi:hypothetical protein